MKEDWRAKSAEGPATTSRETIGGRIRGADRRGGSLSRNPGPFCARPNPSPSIRSIRGYLMGRRKRCVGQFRRAGPRHACSRCRAVAVGGLIVSKNLLAKQGSERGIRVANRERLGPIRGLEAESQSRHPCRRLRPAGSWRVRRIPLLRKPLPSASALFEKGGDGDNVNGFYTAKVEEVGVAADEPRHGPVERTLDKLGVVGIPRQALPDCLDLDGLDKG